MHVAHFSSNSSLYMSPAGIPPRKGAVQKTQWLSQTPVMSAGPKARAGLMHMLLTLPSSHISSGTISPTDKGPSLPHPLQEQWTS